MGVPFRGYGYRLKLLRHHIANECRPEDVVVYCDAFDTLFASGLSSIDMRFRSLGMGVLFSAEKHCWPDAAAANAYPPCHTPYRFLCAGLWVAYVAPILKVFDAMGVELMDDDVDDQREFTRCYLSLDGLIYLDSECSIFQNLHDALDDLEVCGVIVNRVTERCPAVFHGQGLTDMSRVLDALGLSDL